MLGTEVGLLIRTERFVSFTGTGAAPRKINAFILPGRMLNRGGKHKHTVYAPGCCLRDIQDFFEDDDLFEMETINFLTNSKNILNHILQVVHSSDPTL